MTLGSAPLTKGPGQFYARCNLARTVKVHLAKPGDREEAARLGLRRHEAGRDARGRPIWVWRFPHNEGAFEFYDRDTYLAHMAEHHRGGLKLAGPWLAGRWRGPRLKPEGQALCKEAVEQLRSCPGCGLIAQTDDSRASELWWAEHTQGCSLAMAGAAS